jgi:hypothetical protein
MAMSSAERMRKRRAQVIGGTDNDVVSRALEHRLAKMAQAISPGDVGGHPRHQKAAWMRKHYPDMVDETRQQVRADLNLPLKVRR